MHTIIIGAGISGLNAARRLTKEGHRVTVLEKNEHIGGRIATDVIDGFRCDRGFQLINPAYPAARTALNLKALDLHPFARGAVAYLGDERVKLADPSRNPAALPSLLRHGSATDAAAFAKIFTNRSVATLDEAIAEAGLSEIFERVLRTFMAAVVADERLDCSADFGRSLLRYFMAGTPSLPGQGMAAIPAQLAEGLTGAIRFNAEVTQVVASGESVAVTLADGEVLTAEQVIIASDPTVAAHLTGAPVPPTGDLTTWWFAADERPSNSRFLHLDCSEQPLFNHTAVVSNVCPSYAPAGQHLVEVSAVGLREDDPSVIAARAGEVLGANSSRWKLLTTHHVKRALPIIVGNPLQPHGSLQSSGRVHLAGDHAHASIQGALKAGADAASSAAQA